ncbi:LamG domain-containing protein [Streptomyces sp. SID8380]|uniref:LamG domain-containing protein n=1 Tax=Streptomyces sp. SID8380 TaxID=2690360 RepID=UPI001925B7D4|nr:LamG domain-containing protein [Streptomyces sp. SID8380]
MRRQRRGGRWVGALLGTALTLGLLPLAAAPVSASDDPAARETSQQATGGLGAGTQEEQSASETDRAIAEAKASGKPVEVMSLRAESREVFATPEGHLEAREYLRPVRAREDGKWVDVDTDLAVFSAGVRPKAVVTDVTFSAGGDQPLVRMERAGRELALSWPSALPKPQVSGDTATYAEVLPGVDLRMGAQVDGFTQLLVVKSAQAAANPELKSLRLKLAAEGMAVKETAQGGLEAVDDGAGSAVFEAPTPQMWDSSPGPGTGVGAEGAAKAARSATVSAGAGDGEPGAAESGKLAPVAVEVPAGGRELVLTPDEDVLAGEDTQYPVFIDPQWYTPKASSWTMASEYWASSPQWKFNGDHDAGMGFCGWDYCAPQDTKRLFYQIPVSTFAGKSILSAEFVVKNTWSASCDKRKVELWETKGISSSTTWNSQKASGFWIKELASDSFAYGYEGCSAKDAEFSVKSAVQSAANSKAKTMTFGLRASDESDKYAWKRFSDKAYLRVQYNRPPAQVRTSQMLMEYGGSCKPSSSPVRVRTLGKLYVTKVTDPDGDKVAVEFQANWVDKAGKKQYWKPARSALKASGEQFTQALPSTLPANTTINWYVRVWDGAQYSPWSYAGDPQACYFVYDTSTPKEPTIASSEYPASDPADPDDPWYDGVGKYGTFEVKSSSTDVTSYWYGINANPSSARKLTTSAGAAKTFKTLPSAPGLNYVTAQAFDAAGNASAPRTYLFKVRAGQPDRATWQFDESTGAGEAQGSTPARTMDTHDGVTLGEQGAIGTAAHFNGTDGYAYSDLPVVNTSGGFAVSAWVKLDEVPGQAAVVASQTGNDKPGFELYYSSSYDRWIFNQYSEDKPGTVPVVRAMSAQPGDAKAGVWTHLVGSYSSTDDKLALYVDGKLAGETAYSTPWEARRGFQIGAGSYDGGGRSAFFPGLIDEVQVFDKPLTVNEVAVLKEKKDVGDPGRPAVAQFPLDEAAGATKVEGHGQVFPAKYSGGVTTGVEGVTGKAAHFDGTTGYGRIAQDRGPHLNTQRSFTVSAWAKLDKKPDAAADIALQAGNFAPGLELYYSSAYDRWAFNQYSEDAVGAKVIRAMQPDGTHAQIGEWVHLVGVHDTVANTLTLYVNGSKAGTADLPKAWYADQSMYVGAGVYNGSTAPSSYFPGTIDDLRLYDRVVSQEEVSQMVRQHPVLKGRWNFESLSSTTPVTSPDLSAQARPMTLHGGASRGEGYVDDQGVDLNGTDAYLSTATMPVDTGSSFTVTAWAKAAATPDKEKTIFSAEAGTSSPLKVVWVPGSATTSEQGRFELSISDADSKDASVKRLSNNLFYEITDWNHLAVVYDGLLKEARLYVNGVVQEDVCGDDDADGNPDDSGCQDLIAWGENVLSHKATKTFDVGATVTGGKVDTASLFPGSVDDVWAFQGALDDSQVSFLNIPWDLPTEVPPRS